MYRSEVLNSPLGPLLAVERDGKLTGLHFLDRVPRESSPNALVEAGIHSTYAATWKRLGVTAAEVLEGTVARQLAAYFDRSLETFDLPLGPEGTDFQRRVWSTLLEVPHGETWTYGEVAARVGDTHARPVGAAVGKNPIPIVIPCHRVVAGNRRLGGFSGGLERKAHLLRLEGAISLESDQPLRFGTSLVAKKATPSLFPES